MISCRTLKQEDCLWTFSSYLLLQTLFPSRAAVFLSEDLSQNASTASFPVWSPAIHQACNFPPSLRELFSFFLRKRMMPLQVKEIESSVKELSASWIDTQNWYQKSWSEFNYESNNIATLTFRTLVFRQKWRRANAQNVSFEIFQYGGSLILDIKI